MRKANFSSVQFRKGDEAMPVHNCLLLYRLNNSLQRVRAWNIVIVYYNSVEKNNRTSILTVWLGSLFFTQSRKLYFISCQVSWVIPHPIEFGAKGVWQKGFVTLFGAMYRRENCRVTSHSLCTWKRFFFEGSSTNRILLSLKGYVFYTHYYCYKWK